MVECLRSLSKYYCLFWKVFCYWWVEFLDIKDCKCTFIVVGSVFKPFNDFIWVLPLINLYFILNFHVYCWQDMFTKFTKLSMLDLEICILDGMKIELMIFYSNKALLFCHGVKFFIQTECFGNFFRFYINFLW